MAGYGVCFADAPRDHHLRPHRSAAPEHRAQVR
jgi:hypothetical protein